MGELPLIVLPHPTRALPALARRHFPSLLAGACLLAVLLVPLARSLGGTERLGFRDVGHFYTPLYGHLAERERRQWLPLHNPLDELGIPLIGETTTAVFYPPRRLIFWLVAEPETALAWYVFGHLLAAGIAACYAAQRAGADPHGAAFAMLIYPLSGPILFLYSNPPFLVSAAWMPLALAGGLGLLSRFSARDLAITAIALALMVLGGDPQTAANVGVIGLLFAAFTIVRHERRGRLRILASFSGAVALSILLAFPQVVGSLDWALQSVRYGAGGRPAAIYDFSVAPWHWAELFLPTAAGRLFPIYTRISHLLPNDGRTWAVTLYAGAVPLALTWLRYRQPGHLRRDGWDALLPIAVVASLGSFGLGYVANWLAPSSIAAWGPAGAARDASGGLHWWLTLLIPGYSGFRYPAKWLIFAPLGIAIAAARQADRLRGDDHGQLRRTLWGCLLIATLLAAGIFFALRRMTAVAPQALEIADPLWGPLNSTVALRDLGWGWAALAAIISTACLLLRLVGIGHKPRAIFAAFLILIGIDLGLAAWSAVATIDRNAEASWLAMAERRHPPAVHDPHDRVLRLSLPGWPAELRSQPSPGHSRLLLAEAAQRANRFGRWHLTDHTAVVNSAVTLPSDRVATFWRAANAESRVIAASERELYWRRIFAWLAVTRLANDRDSVNDRAQLGSQSATDTGGTESRRIAEQHDRWLGQPLAKTSRPFTWHPAWREIPQVDRVTTTMIRGRLRELATADTNSDRPLVETVGRGPLGKPLDAAASQSSASRAAIRTLPSPPDHWRIGVVAPSPGLLCWKQYQDGNLRAELISRRGPATDLPTRLTVYRSDYLFSAVKVPAGEYELVISYRPPWLVGVVLVWGLAWGGLLLGWSYCQFRPGGSAPT